MLCANPLEKHRQGQFKDNLPIGTWTELYSLVSSHTVTGQYINGLREGTWALYALDKHIGNVLYKANKEVEFIHFESET